jgi:hypothetical protein
VVGYSTTVYREGRRLFFGSESVSSPGNASLRDPSLPILFRKFMADRT